MISLHSIARERNFKVEEEEEEMPGSPVSIVTQVGGSVTFYCRNPMCLELANTSVNPVGLPIRCVFSTFLPSASQG